MNITSEFMTACKHFSKVGLHSRRVETHELDVLSGLAFAFFLKVGHKPQVLKVVDWHTFVAIHWPS